MADSPLTAAASPVEISSRVAWAAIAAAVVLVFFPLCRFEFTSWDDEAFIARNPRFINPSWSNAGRAWLAPSADIYVPVAASVWMALAAAGHADLPDANGHVLNPYLFHSANVILHAAAGIAAFEVLRRVLGRRWPALAGAMLFVLHPLQVETVGWISGLKDVLGGLFSLTAIALYLAAAGRKSEGRRAARLYVTGLLLFALALLSKPSVMTTAAIVGVIDQLWLGRDWRTVLRWTAPWLMLAIACAAAARSFQPPRPNVDVVPILERPLIAGHALAFYFGKLVWPAKLGIDYGQNPATVMKTTWFYAAWLVPLAAVVLAGAAYRRSRLPLLGVVIFILGPFAMLGWTPFDFQTVSTAADHYLYTGMLGAALLFGWLISRLPRAGAIGVGVVVLLSLAARTFVQTGTWRDTQSLFDNAIAVNPNSWVSRTSLAVLNVDHGELQAGFEQAERAIALNPNFALPWVVVGSVRGQTGDLPGATQAYRHAVELEPRQANILTNLGGILAQQGNFEEASPILRQALALDPDNAQAATNLGSMLLDQGKPTEAEPLLRQAVALDPYDARARMNLAAYYLAVHRQAEAVEQLRAAYAINPAAPGLLGILQQLGLAGHSAP